MIRLQIIRCTFLWPGCSFNFHSNTHTHAVELVNRRECTIRTNFAYSVNDTHLNLCIGNGIEKNRRDFLLSKRNIFCFTWNKPIFSIFGNFKLRCHNGSNLPFFGGPVRGVFIYLDHWTRCSIFHRYRDAFKCTSNDRSNDCFNAILLVDNASYVRYVEYHAAFEIHLRIAIMHDILPMANLVVIVIACGV